MRLAEEPYREQCGRWDGGWGLGGGSGEEGEEPAKIRMIWRLIEANFKSRIQQIYLSNVILPPVSELVHVLYLLISLHECNNHKI